MTFQEWLSKRSRTGSVKGKIIELLRQSHDPEKLILNLKDGKIKGVTKVEWEASRRIVWDFGKAGGVWSDGVRARADKTPAEPGSYADGGPMEGTGGGAVTGIQFQPPAKVQQEEWVAGFLAAMEAAFGLSYAEVAADYSRMSGMSALAEPIEAADDPV